MVFIIAGPSSAMPSEETATVRVTEGLLRGRRVESRAGGAFWSFQGVPYARPPVGPLRFKDAQPPEAWQGVRDALKDGNICTQPSETPSQEIIGSEDCLYLNVYSPRLPPLKTDALPVVVSLHGGAFKYGDAGVNRYGPDYLVAEDVVLVTLNYRLGPLGFLFMEDACPGNAGLKDQVAALRWVKENIKAFGGNAENVTLIGMSAGGASVHFQMLSPMTKGLFHRAIAMSGSALSPWAQQTEPADTTRRLARALGCASDDPHAIVDFLKGVDDKKLLRVAYTTDAKGNSLKFVPSAEVVVKGVETFLPAPAYELISAGRHHDIPFMMGFTGKEGLLQLIFTDVRKPDIAQEVDRNLEDLLLPELPRLPKGFNKAAAIKALRDFYLKGKPISRDTLQAFVDMMSDINFCEGITYSLNCMAKHHTAPLYHYVFTVDDVLNYMKFLTHLNEKGACHGDDLAYVFDTAAFPAKLPPDSSALVARKRMVRLLSNFAKTGVPSSKQDTHLGVEWKSYKTDEKNYLEIGSSLKSGTNLHAERVAFWEKFYKPH
ncbi:Esterase FE4 [Gryllus bimaculatus]|nr:Esterase FE4 [Gryllus bimaculatus]